MIKQNKQALAWNILSQYRSEIMGFAIIGIMLFHWYENCMIHNIPLKGILSLFSFGNKFVDVFLLLSGMGLFYSLKKNSVLKEFYYKRVVKILPSYCILAIPYWLLMDTFIAGEGLKSVVIDFTFISFFTEGNRRFWFIGAIIAFYLMFPILYKVICHSKETWRGMVLLLIIWLLVEILIWKLSPELYGRIEIAIGRIPSFIVGAYIGGNAYNKKSISLKWYGALLGLQIVSMAFSLYAPAGFAKQLVYRGSGSVFAVVVAVMLGWILRCLEKVSVHQLLKKYLRFLGELTMEIYILHVAFRSIFDYPAGIVEYSMLICASVIIAIPVHRVSEGIQRKCLKVLSFQN